MMKNLKVAWEYVTWFVSAEWALSHSANGGDVILLRGLWTTAWVCGIGFALHNLLDPSRTWQFSSRELRAQLMSSGGWIGAVFAGVYTALYARFASQWQYLAGVYNQIKSAECREGHDAEKIAEWKYGFIEDAHELHLALKPMFAGIIQHWCKDERVGKRCQEEIANGSHRLRGLLTRLRVTLEDLPGTNRRAAE